MEIKLGQMLVRSGVISTEELDEALKNQVIFGNRLGTSLVELGYLTEDGLASFLSKQLQVPAVSAEELLRVPQTVLSLVPQEIVQKYRIIPYRLDNRRLTIVMADPTDLVAMDELSFITGLIILPAVSPELGIFRAMEACYGIRHEKRGLEVPAALKQTAMRDRSEQKTHILTAATASAPPIPSEEVVEFPPIDDFLGFHREGERSAEALPYPAAIESYTVDTLSRALAEATDREAIADALISYFRQEMPIAALFFVRGKSAVGWQASINGAPVADFQHLSISLTEPSVLSPVVEGKSPYLGPIADTPAHAGLLSALAAADSSVALILPIVLMGRVVAILYLGNDIDILTRRLVELQRLTMKTALSFEILILRSKILMS